jgi:hypothetical protein
VNPDDATVTNLIKALTDIPGDWLVYGTKKGSLEVREPGGKRYGFVFPDGRPTRYYTATR